VNNAFRIVEVGRSYGVSTLYLAVAVRDNVHPAGGVVIGTEYEPKKAFAARANFREAGLRRFIDLRERDLRETLKQIDGPVDFMLSISGPPWHDPRWSWSPRISGRGPL